MSTPTCRGLASHTGHTPTTVLATLCHRSVIIPTSSRPCPRPSFPPVDHRSARPSLRHRRRPSLSLVEIQQRQCRKRHLPSATKQGVHTLQRKAWKTTLHPFLCETKPTRLSPSLADIACNGTVLGATPFAISRVIRCFLHAPYPLHLSTVCKCSPPSALPAFHAATHVELHHSTLQRNAPLSNRRSPEKGGPSVKFITLPVWSSLHESH